jgi:hypothetical protein
MQVFFSRGVRCDTNSVNCSSWPDTPWDQYCHPSAASCSRYTPTFWTPSKLSAVTTRVWDPGTSAYKDVDRWDLTYGFPVPGDGTSALLWLHQITHTGLVGGSVGTPTMFFGGTALPNRVESWAPRMTHYRLAAIDTRTGRETRITYENADCPMGSFDNRTNPYRCFPQHLGAAGWGWFHKYVFSFIREIDLNSGSPDMWTWVGYSTVGANQSQVWGYDTNETALAGNRLWSQWKGYPNVVKLVGPDQANQTATRTIYYRGLDGDGQPYDGTPLISRITDSQGVQTVDHPALAGRIREQYTLDIADPMASTIYDYSVTQTASRPTSPPQTNWVSYRTLTTAERSRTKLLHNNTWRWTRTEYPSHNAYGLPTAIKSLGDTGTGDTNPDTTDDVCTDITYTNPNTATHLIDYRARELVHTCVPVGSRTDADHLKVTDYFWDNATATSTAPAQGLLTKTKGVKSSPPAPGTGSSSAAPSTTPTGESRRPTTAWTGPPRPATCLLPVHRSPRPRSRTLPGTSHPLRWNPAVRYR